MVGQKIISFIRACLKRKFTESAFHRYICNVYSFTKPSFILFALLNLPNYSEVTSIKPAVLVYLEMSSLKTSQPIPPKKKCAIFNEPFDFTFGYH